MDVDLYKCCSPFSVSHQDSPQRNSFHCFTLVIGRVFTPVASRVCLRTQSGLNPGDWTQVSCVAALQPIELTSVYPSSDVLICQGRSKIQEFKSAKAIEDLETIFSATIPHGLTQQPFCFWVLQAHRRWSSSNTYSSLDEFTPEVTLTNTTDSRQSVPSSVSVLSLHSSGLEQTS